MVGFASTAAEERELRITDALQEAGLPGEREDHQWIARRLNRCLDLVEGDADRLEPLLVSGLLLEMGQDPSRVSGLQGRSYPDSWLRSVPPLLRSGFPVRTWQLVEGGVLTYEGKGLGSVPRWRINGRALKPLLDQWHELAGELTAVTLAKALLPLAIDEKNGLQVTCAGLPIAEARAWAAGLRASLKKQHPDARVHVIVG
jgi:hypothetical protein